MDNCPPVLFLIFNRPDKTAHTLNAIRSAKPKRLYVAADGPRASRENEKEQCNATRAVIESVNWDCEVKTLFRESNLGCRRAVSEGITWFFEQEQEGIVIEDDIWLDPSFFTFAAEMLERYRDDLRVMAITACNLQPKEKRYTGSYYFSAYNNVWGWASWARSWAKYSDNLDDLDTPVYDNAVNAMCPVAGARSFWKRALLGVRSGEIDSWAYIWLYTQWKSRGLTITPSVNMMKNTGLDQTATHTQSSEGFEATLASSALDYPIVHPEEVIQDTEADEYMSKKIFKIRPRTLLSRINRWRKGEPYAWV